MRHTIRPVKDPARVAAAVVVLAAVAGCGATTEGTPVSGTAAVTPPNATKLVAALATVRATDETAVLVEYGDVAAVRELQAADRQRFRALEGYGYSDLAGQAPVLAERVGFDPRRASEAVRVGTPPKWAGVLRMPVDVARVNSEFERLGAKRADEAGATTWITAEDDQVDLAGPVAELGIVSGFNRVRVAADSIAFAPSGAALARVVEPGGSTLAQEAAVLAPAACLGDVVAAVITTRPSPIAVGVRASGDRVEEVVCVPSGAPAELRDRVRARLDDVRPERGPVWSTVLRDAEAEVPGDQAGVVRVVVPAGPGATVGRVFQSLQRNELPALFG